MLRDVTFGQFYPVDSFVHKMDARAKILLAVLYLVGIFFVDSYFGFGIILTFLLVAIASARVPLGSVLKSIKGILLILIFTALLNLFFTTGDNLLFSWWIFNVYLEGVIFSSKMILRLIFIVMGASLLTLTTTPVDLTHGVESLLKPLKLIKFPVHELALIMSLTLSFIPSLVEETDRIVRAQKARGASFDTGNIFERVKAFIPILIPLLVSSCRRAEELAFAMNSRCYEGSTVRTKYKVQKFTWRDFVGSFVELAVFACVFTLFALRETLSHVGWLYL